MYAPASHDEITGIVNYLGQQLDALHAAAVGLTEEQARSRPCRSALSVGGLVKHGIYVMRGAIARLRGDGPADPYDPAAYAAYGDSFVVGDDETVAGLLARFDQVRAEYLDAVAATDPSATVIEPPSPWFGRYEPQPALARYYLVHQIEELARHAGHADILREEVDGISIANIVLTHDGVAANDFFQPYEPAAGTIWGS